MATGFTRRDFLGFAGIGAASLAATSLPGWVRSAAAQPTFGADPFTLGVPRARRRRQASSSGRGSTPDPLAPDGTGGMPHHRFPVRWELYEHGPNQYRSPTGRPPTPPRRGSSPGTTTRSTTTGRRGTGERRAAAGGVPGPAGRGHAGLLGEHAPAPLVAPGRDRPAALPAAPLGVARPVPVLDTRQYRSDQACGDGTRIGCEERLDPARTITGAEQEAWLFDGLDRSTSAWNVLAQQVVFSQRDFEAGPVERYSSDAWGYRASRDRVVAGILERRPSHPVVLTGDVHVGYAADLKADFSAPASETFGVELVGPSITSGGNGSDTTPAGRTVLSENPQFRFFNAQRGYVSCTVTEEAWRADYRVLPSVTSPRAPVPTSASFVTERGRPGLQPA